MKKSKTEREGESPNREKWSAAHQSLGRLLWQLSWQRTPFPLSLLSLYFFLFRSQINSNALKCHSGCSHVAVPVENKTVREEHE